MGNDHRQKESGLKRVTKGDALYLAIGIAAGGFLAWVMINGLWC